MKKTALKTLIFAALTALCLALCACKTEQGVEQFDSFEVLIAQSQEGIASFEVQHGEIALKSGDLVQDGSVLSISWQLDEGYNAVLYINEQATELDSGGTIKIEAATEIRLVAQIRHYVINFSVQAQNFRLYLGDSELASGASVPHGAILNAQWTENSNYVYTVNAPKAKDLVFTQSDCQFEVVDNIELIIFARRLYNIEINLEQGITARLETSDKTITDEGKVFEGAASIFYELENGYLLTIFLNGTEVDLKSGEQIIVEGDVLIEFFTERVYNIEFDIEQNLLQYLVVTDQEGNAISPPFNAGQSVKIRWDTDLYRSEFEFLPAKFVDYGQFYLLESIGDDFVVSVTATRQHKLTISNTYDCVSILGEQRHSGEIIYLDEGTNISVDIESQFLSQILLNNQLIEVEFDGSRSFFEFDLNLNTELDITLLCLVGIDIADGFTGLSVVNGELSINDGDYLPLNEFLMIEFEPLADHYLYVDLILQTELTVLKKLTKDMLIEVRHEFAPQVTVDVDITFDAHFLDWIEVRVLSNNEVVFRHDVDSEGAVSATLPVDLELIFVLSYEGANITLDGQALIGGFYAQDGQQFDIVSGYLIELVGMFSNIKCYYAEQEYLQVYSGYYYPVNAEIVIIYDRYDYAKLLINGELVHTAIMERFEYSFMLVSDTVVTLQLI